MSKLADRWKKNSKEYILILVSFSFFLFLALRKLTAAPLWLDETLEYYISRFMTGDIPWYSNNGVTEAHNMYERMLGAFQPPLYNFVMYFWLQINDSEWWFRISSVIMSTFAAAGIYKTVKRFSTYYVAALSVLIYSCIYEVMYYTQECGEYVMQLMFLAWLFYFYLAIMEERTVKNMISFVLLCILNMYTQYGAAFIIIPLVCSVMIRVYKSGEAKKVKYLIKLYIIAGIAGAGPLLLLFVIPQLKNQTNVVTNPEAWNFYNNNIFSDLLQMFLDVFRWNTIESFTRFYWPALFASLLLLFLGVFYCIKGRNTCLKHLLVCNVITWFLYYIPTRAGIYGRGYFGFRYNIFFIPMWLVTILYLCYELYQMLLSIRDEHKRKIGRKLYQTAVLVAAAGYCFYGTHQILKHWEKADTRGCVQEWYAREGYQTLTFVEPGQVPSFSYYYEHNEDYEPEFDQNVIREISKTAENALAENQYEIEYELYQEEMKERFQDTWPEELYCFVGDSNNSALMAALKDEGYQVEEVYKTTAQLYYLHK